MKLTISGSQVGNRQGRDLGNAQNRVVIDGSRSCRLIVERPWRITVDGREPLSSADQLREVRDYTSLRGSVHFHGPLVRCRE